MERLRSLLFTGSPGEAEELPERGVGTEAAGGVKAEFVCQTKKAQKTNS